jgi:hypothetical protein
MRSFLLAALLVSMLNMNRVVITQRQDHDLRNATRNSQANPGVAKPNINPNP